jgi:hypothetical protein
MKSILKWVLGLYVRCDHHHDHASRASKLDVFRSRRMRLSYVKGAVCSTIWPAYLAIQRNRVCQN